MKFWGWFAVALLLAIILVPLSGCASAPTAAPAALPAARGPQLCAVQFIGKNEQGITVLRFQCEAE